MTSIYKQLVPKHLLPTPGTSVEEIEARESFFFTKDEKQDCGNIDRLGDMLTCVRVEFAGELPQECQPVVIGWRSDHTDPEEYADAPFNQLQPCCAENNTVWEWRGVIYVHPYMLLCLWFGRERMPPVSFKMTCFYRKLDTAGRKMLSVFLTDASYKSVCYKNEAIRDVLPTTREEHEQWVERARVEHEQWLDTPVSRREFMQFAEEIRKALLKSDREKAFLQHVAEFCP